MGPKPFGIISSRDSDPWTSFKQLAKLPIFTREMHSNAKLDFASCFQRMAGVIVLLFPYSNDSEPLKLQRLGPPVEVRLRVPFFL